jgi:hypothetical protein
MASSVVLDEGGGQLPSDSRGKAEGENYWEFLTCLSTALAIKDAAYAEAKRRRNL